MESNIEKLARASNNSKLIGNDQNLKVRSF